VLSLKLPGHLENSVLSGHPWIYRNQLPKDFEPREACWVELVLEKLRAFALYDPDSALALRVYSREGRVDEGFVRERVQEAWALRALWRAPERTDAFRLLNGEGDQLPGVVADCYGGFVVIKLASRACELLLPWLVSAIAEVVTPSGIVFREGLRKEGGATERLTALHGALPPRELWVRENGLALKADLYHGQKTGLFLDQRDNRALVERYARGRRVLNLFAYSGGFSLYAARGGAKRVTSVDLAGPALRDAEENFRKNGFDPGSHAFVTADVFEYLERQRLGQERFDFVICDPPSFGSQKAQLDKALAAYTRLFAAAMKVTEPGALFAASSCTARVTAPELARALAQSARKARRQVQLIADTAHAPDHPIAVGHPEGRYLKFLLGVASARA
jgi:23S rRNA (cytosine1962-C5)-methyltransferase